MIQIRRSVYQGWEGFTVCGKEKGLRPVKIFVRRRSTATAIKAVINNDRLTMEERNRLVDGLICCDMEFMTYRRGG